MTDRPFLESSPSKMFDPLLYSIGEDPSIPESKQRLKPGDMDRKGSDSGGVAMTNGNAITGGSLQGLVPTGNANVISTGSGWTPFIERANNDLYLTKFNSLNMSSPSNNNRLSQTPNNIEKTFQFADFLMDTPLGANNSGNITNSFDTPGSFYRTLLGGSAKKETIDSSLKFWKTPLKTSSNQFLSQLSPGLIKGSSNVNNILSFNTPSRDNAGRTVIREHISNNSQITPNIHEASSPSTIVLKSSEVNTAKKKDHNSNNLPDASVMVSPTPAKIAKVLPSKVGPEGTSIGPVMGIFADSKHRQPLMPKYLNQGQFNQKQKLNVKSQKQQQAGPKKRQWDNIESGMNKFQIVFTDVKQIHNRSQKKRRNNNNQNGLTRANTVGAMSNPGLPRPNNTQIRSERAIFRSVSVPDQQFNYSNPQEFLHHNTNGNTTTSRSANDDLEEDFVNLLRNTRG
ncbi:BA75_02667T0 [Komagataella pastoris]|uniref:BA75_02667T0 n=1 Tax=Komagataella pastoris TaxID=4922 RepID=A0A1B2JBV6_PICPA|nr:BA75_02667T0 [Komagataella pastoris]